MGFRVQSLRLRVWGPGLRMEDKGSRVKDQWLRVWGLGFRV